jgi:uncharacterized membrane protein
VTVIVNPTTRQVTHLVVADKSFPRSIQRLVPVEQVLETSSGSIRLACTQDQLAEMEPFAETQFVEIERTVPYPDDLGYAHPYVTPYESTQVAMEVERIPPGELAVRRGTRLQATDGDVGEVGELMVDPESGSVTHLVLQQGHLWGKKEIALPLSIIDFVGEDTVYLTLDKEAIAQLPAIPVRRHYGSREAESELVARVYDDLGGAEQALEFVRDLQRRKTLKILNSALLVKDEDGEVTLEEKGDLDAKQGRLFGAITGGLVGLVGGPVGVVVGALAGAGVGGLAAKWIDMGFSDTFLAGLQERLQPGSSALILLVEHEWANSLSDALADTGGTFFRQSLTDELVKQLEQEAAGDDSPEE